VSAFASEARIVLGQVKTDEKSNEITAIPELLDLLNVKGGIVSIHAMGAQKEIAAKIIEKGGDYILALKGNQSSLHDDIKLFFDDEMLVKRLQSHEHTSGGHGRIEIRTCTVTDAIGWLKENHDWSGPRTIVQIKSEVEIKGKRPWKPAITLPLCHRTQRKCWLQSAVTGQSKTLSTGYSICHSAMTSPESAKETLQKISPS